ncbi:MAG: helix-turn-helix transcriptional regulator [Chloroflexi bacterium]|nr:helix-turn-helix transcriptional regulator [Chloroflexota bacterium]
MPHVSRKPLPDKAAPLTEVLKNYLDTKGISVRKAAAQMDIGASHLSHIMKGEKSPDAGVCNAIADFLGIPRVQVYGLAGWLDLDEQDDEALTEFLTSFVKHPEQLDRLKWIYYSIGEKNARNDFLKLIERNLSPIEVKTHRLSDLNE